MTFLYRTLVTMNFVYAAFCLVVALKLSGSEIYGGAILVFVEGIFVAALATVERKLLNSKS